MLMCSTALTYSPQVAVDYLIYSAGTKGAQRMRKAFCTSVIKAPMSFFMSENLGPIIQVFSRDLTVVTEDLIDSFNYAVIYSFITVAIIIRTVQDLPLFCVVGFPLLMVAAFILRLYSSKLKIVKTEPQIRFRLLNDACSRTTQRYSGLIPADSRDDEV